MRFNEVKKLIESEEDLFEINMSPGNLENLVKNIDARAGMEFEMIVPDTNADDDDEGDLEPDYDQDESVTDISDAINFFRNGENSRRQLSDLRDRMEEEFSNWALEQFDDEWSDKAYQYVYEYLTENADAKDIVEILDLDTDGEEAKEILDDGPSKTNVKEAAQKVAEDPDRYLEWWEGARDNAQDEYVNEGGADQTEWLQSIGVNSMLGVMEYFDNIVDWPYWETVGGGDNDGSDIAYSFSNAIGRPATYYGGYHRGERRPGEYVVEPDSSLDAEPGDAGLEFVSPPLPIDQMFSDLDKVKKWADNRGCYTGKQYNTGLHINVSVPGYDLSKLDYVKLALLLGDKYVLKEFNRLGNHYAKSAMDIVKQRVTQRPEDAAMMLKSLKGKLGDLATKIIHSGATDKYVSINTKTGYIEFRGPGGDWLSDDYFNKIKPTLLRFVVAMDAAMDPQKYRDEYLKKLYALLQPKSKEDTLSYFAKFAAGELPKSALKSFIKQAQLERKVAKDPTGGQKYWWDVSNPQYSFASIEVVATTKEEAIEKALGPDGYPSWANTRQSIVAKPLRPFDTSPVRATVGEPQPVGRQPAQFGAEQNESEFELVRRNTGEVVHRFYAVNRDAAIQQAVSFADMQGWDLNDYEVKAAPIPGSTIDLQRQRAAAQTAGSQGNWGIWLTGENRFSRAPGQSDNRVLRRFPSREAAEQWIEQTRATNPALRHDIEVREIEPAAQQIPEVPLDIEIAPQRPPQSLGAGREFAGWRVLLPTGEEVYRFSGVGNSQADANRIAAEWLRNNGMGVSGEGFEVVPVWREA